MQKSTETQEHSIDAEAALALLSDGYAKGILEALRRDPSTANELIDCCSGSKVTIYRRLNSLQDAGLISSRTKLQIDGNHCEVYYTIVDRVTISITDEGFVAEVDRQ